MNRYDPFAHAETLGITVGYSRLRTANGLWLPEYNTIVVKDGMRAVHTRIALAHEIGHAVHGHEDDRPRHEQQADRYAAVHLIDRDELLQVAGWAGHPNIIAAELGVTRRILLAYVDSQRLVA